jgi:hypothetical protein
MAHGIEAEAPERLGPWRGRAGGCISRVIRVTDDDLRDPTVFIGVLHRALRERLS